MPSLWRKGAAVYFRVETSDGEKFICYRPGDGQAIDEGDNVICFGLGIEPDGQWHAITRNLADDLELAIPDSLLISIKDFLRIWKCEIRRPHANQKTRRLELKSFVFRILKLNTLDFGAFSAFISYLGSSLNFCSIPNLN